MGGPGGDGFTWPVVAKVGFSQDRDDRPICSAFVLFPAKLSGAPGLALQPGRLPQTVPVGHGCGPLSGRHRGGP